MSRSACFKFLVIALAAVGTIGVSYGQGGSGTLTGRVVDPSGAVVSNGSVVLTNSATGEKRTTVTTTAGTYSFPALPVVGSYSVRVSAQGFKTAEVADIVISVGTITT